MVLAAYRHDKGTTLLSKMNPLLLPVFSRLGHSKSTILFTVQRTVYLRKTVFRTNTINRNMVHQKLLFLKSCTESWHLPICAKRPLPMPLCQCQRLFIVEMLINIWLLDMASFLPSTMIMAGISYLCVCIVLLAWLWSLCGYSHILPKQTAVGTMLLWSVWTAPAAVPGQQSLLQSVICCQFLMHSALRKTLNISSAYGSTVQKIQFTFKEWNGNS